MNVFVQDQIMLIFFLGFAVLFLLIAHWEL